MEKQCKLAALNGATPEHITLDSEISYKAHPMPCIDIALKPDEHDVATWTFSKPFESEETAVAFCKELELAPHTQLSLMKLSQTIASKVKIMTVLQKCQQHYSSKLTADSSVQKGIEIEILAVYEKQNISPLVPQWGFDLKVFATNTGMKNLQKYSIQVGVPIGILNPSANDSYELRQNRTESHRFYCFPGQHQTQSKELFPGKQAQVGTIHCLFFKHNENIRSSALQSNLELEVFAEDIPASRFSFPISTISPSRITEVDPKDLEFNKIYTLGIFK